MVDPSRPTNGPREPSNYELSQQLWDLRGDLKVVVNRLDYLGERVASYDGLRARVDVLELSTKEIVDDYRRERDGQSKMAMDIRVALFTVSLGALTLGIGVPIILRGLGVH